MDDAPRTTVLVVDDETTLREAIKAGLERNSAYRVLVAADGEAGVHLLANDHPDVLLLDIALPGIDGFQVLEQLGPSGPVPRPSRVIAMSAMTDKTTTDRLGRLGADAILPKPFTLAELRTAIES